MKKFAVAVCIFLLAGCFSTKNSTFYLLESQGNAEPITQKKLSIAVQDISIPDYLQKPQIVLQSQDSPELKVSEFNRWGSDLPSMLQNTLIEDLQSLMPNAFIKPLMFGQTAQYTIQINIEKLSGYLKEQAVLKGSYKIVLPNGKLFKEENFDLSTPAGKTYASYVTAQSKLISDLAQEIAGTL